MKLSKKHKYFEKNPRKPKVVNQFSSNVLHKMEFSISRKLRKAYVNKDRKKWSWNAEKLFEFAIDGLKGGFLREQSRYLF